MLEESVAQILERLEEQSFGVHGPWVGWSHHRWLCEIRDGRIEFVSKPHELHGRAEHHFPREVVPALSPEERVATMFWEGSFAFTEWLFMDGAELDNYLAEFVSACLPDLLGGATRHNYHSLRDRLLARRNARRARAAKRELAEEIGEPGR